LHRNKGAFTVTIGVAAGGGLIRVIGVHFLEFIQCDASLSIRPADWSSRGIAQQKDDRENIPQM
jgi:hypothetical protein